jgi:3D (Asp-Asp-Asp) domain-containing protein
MNQLKLSTIFLTCLAILYPEAEARRRYRPVDLCGGQKATSTVYNLPQEDKRETWKGFRTFQSAVNMQGSGRRANGKIARYKGPDVTVPSSCKTTTTSASGQCLLSYFSIAADPRSGWRMGDIIYMRSLADQEITLPSGRRVRHPGFLIVHDTGGAIKGPNRFDFFIGPTATRDSAFQKFKLADKNECAGKDYQKVERGSAKYSDALAQIYKNQDSDTSRGQSADGGPSQILANRSAQ